MFHSISIYASFALIVVKCENACDSHFVAVVAVFAAVVRVTVRHLSS